MVSRPMTCDDLVEVITHQNQEIAKLRKVVADIKQEVEWADSKKLSYWTDDSAISDIKQIIAEYDEREGQE